MRVPVGRLGRVFGDRVLVRRLDGPEKVGVLFVPATVRQQPKEQDLWFGEVVAFGLDSRYQEAYGLAIGDVVGLHDMSLQCASFEGEDGKTYVWAPEEFLALKDTGAVKAHRENQSSYHGLGLVPLGPYAVVQPDPEETSRNGVVLPDSAKTPTRTGEVKSVSLGLVRGQEVQALNLTKGSQVLFGKFSGSWCRLGKKQYLLVKEEDVIAELTPAKEPAHAR